MKRFKSIIFALAGTTAINAADLKLGIQNEGNDVALIGVQGGPGVHRLQTTHDLRARDWSVKEKITTQTNIGFAKSASQKFIRGQAAPANDVLIFTNTLSMLDRGRDAFRHDTFGSESFWGGT